MATTVTVTLPKSAKRAATVRHGARVYTVEPGGSAEVSERVAGEMARQGAKVKGTTTGGEDSEAATS